MGARVSELDRSGWSSEALARAARFADEQRAFTARAKAVKAHPLATVLDGLTDGSRAASEAIRTRMVARDFENGHREVVIYREQPDLCKRLERAIDRDVDVLTPRGEGDRDASRAASTRRAKQKVRHICKAMAVNSLWTLTYKENVLDRDRALRDFDRFRRRVVEVLGEWRYVAVLQQQERGAWHIHIASHALPARVLVRGVKVKSWDAMRAIWRAIVGEGNFDESKRKARWSKGDKPIRGCGAIASYIAGYVAKDMLESELNRKRYSVSKGVDIPAGYRAMWAGDVAMSELIELAYAALGDRITRTWFDATRGIFFAESDDTEDRHRTSQ